MAALTSVTLGFLFSCSWILAVNPDPEELSARPGEDVTLQCQGPKHISIALLKWIRPDLESDRYVFFFRDNRPYERYQHQSYQGRVSLIDPRLKHGNASVLLKNVSISDTGTYHCHVSVSISKGFREENTEEITDKVILKVTAGQTEDGGNNDGGDKDGRDNDGGDKDGRDNDGGDKDGRDNDGGDKDGRDNDGGDKDGRDNDGGDKDGRDNKGGDKDGGNLLLVVILPVIALLVIVIVSLILCKYEKHVKKSSERPAADEAAEKKKLSSERVPQ